MKLVPTRLKYPIATRTNNPDNSSAATQRIGSDSQATKNWWDVK